MRYSIRRWDKFFGEVVARLAVFESPDLGVFELLAIVQKPLAISWTCEAYCSVYDAQQKLKTDNFPAEEPFLDKGLMEEMVMKETVEENPSVVHDLMHSIANLDKLKK